MGRGDTNVPPRWSALANFPIALPLSAPQGPAQSPVGVPVLRNEGAQTQSRALDDSRTIFLAAGGTIPFIPTFNLPM